VSYAGTTGTVRVRPGWGSNSPERWVRREGRMPRVGGGLDAFGGFRGRPIGGSAFVQFDLNGNAECLVLRWNGQLQPRRECLDHVIVFGATAGSPLVL